MKHRFEGGVLLPQCWPCSGGRGLCPNEPVCVVATESIRRGAPMTQRRFLCRRCLIQFVGRHICSQCFELPLWVEKLIRIQATKVEPGVVDNSTTA